MERNAALCTHYAACQWVSGSWMKRREALWSVLLPYRGTAQAVNDLVAGHLDLLFMQVDAVREHFAAGKIKMLAVMTPERCLILRRSPRGRVRFGAPAGASAVSSTSIGRPSSQSTFYLRAET